MRSAVRISCGMFACARRRPAENKRSASRLSLGTDFKCSVVTPEGPAAAPRRTLEILQEEFFVECEGPLCLVLKNELRQWSVRDSGASHRVAQLVQRPLNAGCQRSSLQRMATCGDLSHQNQRLSPLCFLTFWSVRLCSPPPLETLGSSCAPFLRQEQQLVPFSTGECAESVHELLFGDRTTPWWFAQQQS